MQTDSPAPPPADPSWRIGIVASCFYKEETAALVAGAREALESAGVPEENILVHDAAGSFEIPLIGRALADAGHVDALIGIGIIVQGETYHADLLAAESARGIMDVQLRCGMPFAFEILHVASLDQARARLQKGREAAYAVLHSLGEFKRILGRKH